MSDVACDNELASSRVQNAKFGMNLLPFELLPHILSYLHCSEIAKICQASTAWMSATASVEEMHAHVFGPNSFVCEPMLRFAINRFDHLKGINIEMQSGMIIPSSKQYSECIGAISDLLTAKCPQLRHFQIVNNGAHKLHDVLSNLEPASNLESLRIIHCYHPHELFHVLENKSKLISLCIHFKKFFYNADVESLHAQIGTLINLQKLELIGPPFRKKLNWDTLFCGMERLRELRCAYIDDDGLKAISDHCKQLQMFHVTNFHSARLSMSFILKVLRNCPIQSLRIFYWKGTTKCGVDHIREICQASDSLLKLNICLKLWPRTFIGEKRRLMEQAALEASGGRVKLTIQIKDHGDNATNRSF
mmetsp:Transcript_2293/g.3651  ORF Transcript_2293/g.3651 Transcript_2293/m.3651 type:complete len:362 (+) Transcript_2293:133-1218(+)|eukprot:CAMPEP_0196811904 /NCGR_PEP_ID=MMETSP1362-20130617/20122_1 /TAXON_ID=163516 /ORGANISM="Leptocylindrus danicus, Strain CCMP1856" /LENGTH=361 /DNA_ID=CAMNT_0042187307 /DNA_START=87 /DNA_END=1172 /DNA_ORIENTATION=-